MRLDNDLALPPSSATIDAAPVAAGSGRPPDDDRRIAIHEAAHALVARSFGRPLGGVTCDPIGNSSGLCWGQSYSIRFAADDDIDVLDQIAALMPREGETHDDLVISHLWSSVVELTAGSEAELLHFGDAWPATSDRQDELRRASLVCSNEESAAAYIAACAAEARAILRQHEDVLLALTDALLESRTLTAEEVDAIISQTIALRQMAAERERRKCWYQTQLNAAVFKTFLLEQKVT
jgi:hypothetical protein